MFTVDFYRTEDGSEPVREFIQGLNIKLRAKVLSDLERLAMIGNELREPRSKHLQDGIFELRTMQGSNIVRLLYFYDRGQMVIVTNGFVKKTQRTPRSEIDLALRRRDEYRKRNGKG